MPNVIHPKCGKSFPGGHRRPSERLLVAQMTVPAYEACGALWHHGKRLTEAEKDRIFGGRA